MVATSCSSSFGNGSDSDLSYFSTTSLGTAATVSTNFDDSLGSLGFSSSNELTSTNSAGKKQGTNAKKKEGGKNHAVRKVKIRKSYMKKRTEPQQEQEEEPQDSSNNTTKKEIRLPSNTKRGSSSTTTGTTKKTVEQKKVKFSTKRQVRKFQKCTEEEKSQVWYEYDELCYLHEKDRVKTLRKLNIHKLGSMIPSFSKMGKSTASVSGATDSSSSKKSYTIRGIEKFVEEQTNSSEEECQDVRIQKFVESVLALYERQMIQGRYTPEKLQRFASSKSIRDVEKARSMGQRDALEVYPEKQKATSAANCKDKGTNSKKTTKMLEVQTPKPTKQKATRSKSSGARLFSKASGWGSTKATTLRKTLQI